MGKQKQPKKKVKNDTKMTVIISILTIVNLISTIINTTLMIIDKLTK